MYNYVNFNCLFYYILYVCLYHRQCQYITPLLPCLYPLLAIGFRFSISIYFLMLRLFSLDYCKIKNKKIELNKLLLLVLSV